MNKIYSVVIKGKTLESRNLRELLARAVCTKRDLDRKLSLQNQSGSRDAFDRAADEIVAAASSMRI